MEFSEEDKKTLNIALKKKFDSTALNTYPSIYFDLKKEITISRKGMSFFSKKVFEADCHMSLMFILPNRISPLFGTGFLLKTEPVKALGGYKYVVNFKDLFFEKDKIFGELDI